MRSSHMCPKCACNEILFVPQLADRTGDGDQPRALAIHVIEFDWKEDSEIGHLQAYVCRSCGYTELYATEPASIPLDDRKVPGIRLLR